LSVEALGKIGSSDGGSNEVIINHVEEIETIGSLFQWLAQLMTKSTFTNKKYRK